MNILLAGNPNTGKTTLFNMLCTSNGKVGNFPGVTVEALHGTLKSKYRPSHEAVKLTDLPGIYTLESISKDEEVSTDLISKNNADLIINVADSVNLERSLYLTLQLKQFNVPMIVVVNKSDLLKKKKMTLDINKLSSELGIKCFLVSTDKKKDIKEFTDYLTKFVGGELDE